jgi:penicillin G amidase
LPKPRRKIRLGCLTALAAGAGLFLLCMNGYRIAMSSYPYASGRLSLPSLTGEVRVVRDGYGVPAVSAANRRDLFFASGYVTAQDRLFQMELSRRAAAGRLSEILGAGALGADSLMRKVGIAEAAAASAATLAPASAEALDAYAAGVNAAVGDGGGRLPVEFKLQAAVFEPWTAADCIAVLRLFAWQADSRWLTAPVRRALAATGPAGGAVPDRLNRTLLAVLEAATRNPFPEGLAADPFGSTFGLVLSGRAALSGKPLLVHAPGAAVQIPCPWYQAVLRCPDFEVSGFTVPGYPLVLSGHNASAAWAFSPSGAVDSPYRTVEWDEASGPKLKTDSLRVWNGAAVPVRTGRTPRGPLICLSPAGAHPAGLALEWPGLEPFDETGPLLAMNRAGTAAEFMSRSERLRLPGIVWIAADTSGGVAVSGTRLPASGVGNGFLWIAAPGFRCRGRLDAAANAWNRPRFDGLASALGRADSLSVSDVRNALADEGSAIDAAILNPLVPGLSSVRRSDSTEAAALRLLAGWNGETRAGNPAAALAETFLDRLSANLFGNGPDAAADSLVLRLPSVALPALAERLAGPGRIREAPAVAEKSFREAVARLKAAQGPDPGSWNWGGLHTLKFRHPLTRQWPFMENRLFRMVFVSGPFPAGGSPSSAGGWVHRPGGPPFPVVSGPSGRLIVDLADFDRSASALSTGQSGQYMDGHYRDQIDLFMSGDFKSDLWSQGKIERSGGNALVLEPAAK